MLYEVKFKLMVLPCQEGNNKDESDLADLIPREDPGRLLGLDPELLLNGGEHGGEVSVPHALHRPQHRVQQDVNLSRKIIAFYHESVQNQTPERFWHRIDPLNYNHVFCLSQASPPSWQISVSRSASSPRGRTGSRSP